MVEFLKMNDGQDVREPKTLSETQPLELPFTFVVLKELSTVSCMCPASEYNARHLHIAPTVGSDDLTPACQGLWLTNFTRQSPSLEQGEENSGTRNIGTCPNLVSAQLAATPVFWQHKSNSWGSGITRRYRVTSGRPKNHSGGKGAEKGTSGNNEAWSPSASSSGFQRCQCRHVRNGQNDSLSLSRFTWDILLSRPIFLLKSTSYMRNSMPLQPIMSTRIKREKTNACIAPVSSPSNHLHRRRRLLCGWRIPRRVIPLSSRIFLFPSPYRQWLVQLLSRGKRSWFRASNRAWFRGHMRFRS